MKKKSLRIKILSGMLCAGLTLSGTSLSFAEVKNDREMVKLVSSMNVKAPMDKEKLREERHAEMRAMLEKVIVESVASGIITKDEGAKVLEYEKNKPQKKTEEKKADKKCKGEKCKGARGGLFADMVTEGIITKEKSEALNEKMHVKGAEMRSEKLQKGLDNLVNSKVLTKEQSVKVKEAITARDAERIENYNKMRNMNENDSKKYVKKMKKNNVNPLKALVNDGTITKAQESEIQKVLPQHKHKGK